MYGPCRARASPFVQGVVAAAGRAGVYIKKLVFAVSLELRASLGRLDKGNVLDNVSVRAAHHDQIPAPPA